MKLTAYQDAAIWQMGLQGRVFSHRGPIKLRTLGSLVERGLAASYFSSAFGGSRFYSLTSEGKAIYKRRLKHTLADLKRTHSR